MELCNFTILGYNGCKVIIGALAAVGGVPILIALAVMIGICLIYAGMWFYYKFF